MNERLRLFIPPIAYIAVRKMRTALQPQTDMPPVLKATEDLQWCPVLSGSLAGRLLYMNPDSLAYQSDMLHGIFDRDLFDYIDRKDWTGKIIYDIGAHIGYHTLNFAYRVGLDGRVFSFEPHPSHIERLKLNLSENEDLAARVTLTQVAIGEKSERLQFIFQESVESIENGRSSASFIEGASTPLPSSYYSDFATTEVDVKKLDDLVKDSRYPPPELIKIDVEGAESLVIMGALETLHEYKPIILVEIHSPANMLHVVTLLQPLGYSLLLLKEEDDGRCLLAFEPEIFNTKRGGFVQM